MGITSRPSGRPAGHRSLMDVGHALARDGRLAWHRCRACTRPTVVLVEILHELENLGIASRFSAVDRLRWRKVADEALPYAIDETGEVWK